MNDLERKSLLCELNGRVKERYARLIPLTPRYVKEWHCRITVMSDMLEGFNLPVHHPVHLYYHGKIVKLVKSIYQESHNHFYYHPAKATYVEHMAENAYN